MDFAYEASVPDGFFAGRHELRQVFFILMFQSLNFYA